MTQTYHFWSKLMYVRDAQTSTVHKYHVLKSSVVRQVDKEMGFICTAVTHTQIPSFARKMDLTGDDHIQQDESDTQR